jgi:hypothetical protein
VTIIFSETILEKDFSSILKASYSDTDGSIKNLNINSHSLEDAELMLNLDFIEGEQPEIMPET